jgi:nitrate reductase gamma subunit
MSDHALFAVAPFVSMVVLVVAATFRPSPSFATLRRVAGSHPLPAIGFLGVLLGHLILVVWPDQLLKWNRDLSRLMAFELALFVLGVAALVGVCTAIRRGVLRRTASGASLVDAAFLGVLLVTLVSGLGVALVYRWAAAWSALTVTRYARSLLSLQPNVEPLEGMPYLVKLHVFSSFIVMALLAFTRLIDVWLNGLLRGTGVVIGPFVSAVDRQWRLLQEWARRSGRSWMWPEEED